ncbi:hypothetical protein BRD56_05355 [Thermoplasmatales archaeon SW_10_69_26]|nr:MAG: hypothetical protein BRD56_05355 [Thermoplasmatales archaeon SW_10_69_26]
MPDGEPRPSQAPPRVQPAPEGDYETTEDDAPGKHVCPFCPEDSQYSSYAKAKIVQHATTWCEHASDEVTRADVEAILDPDDETTVDQILAEYDPDHEPSPDAVDEDTSHEDDEPAEESILAKGQNEPPHPVDEDPDQDDGEADDLDRADLPALPKDLEQHVKEQSYQGDTVRAMLHLADRGEPVSTSDLDDVLGQVWDLDDPSQRRSDAVKLVNKKGCLEDEGWGEWSLARRHQRRRRRRRSGSRGPPSSEPSSPTEDTKPDPEPVRETTTTNEDSPDKDERAVRLELDSEEAELAEQALREMLAGMNQTPSGQRTVLKLWHRLDEQRQEAEP